MTEFLETCVSRLITQLDDILTRQFGSHCSVHALDDLVYEEAYAEEGNNDDESEDSNCEDHYANDYPDEDELSDGNDHDDDGNDNDDDNDDEYGTHQLGKAMAKFIFDDTDDEDAGIPACSSSSDGEDVNSYQDPYVHTREVKDDAFDVDEADVDQADVERYGMGYALYKRRVFKKLTEPLEHDLELVQLTNDKASTSASASCSNK